jgi:MGT family glycosyltransferase
MWEGGGNVPPTLGAIRRLRARGHAVRVIGDATLQGEALAAGAGFSPWRRAPSRVDRSMRSDFLRDWEVSGIAVLERLRDRIMCGPAEVYAMDVLRQLDREPADAVVASEMLFGAMAGAEAANVPLALFCPNISLFPLPGIPPLGAGLRPATSDAERAQHAAIAVSIAGLFDAALPALNSARSACGLAPLSRALDQVAAARRILLATSPAFDFPADWLPEFVRYVGPLLDEPDWNERNDLPWAPAAGERLVLVAFSSTYQAQAKVIQSTLSKLASVRAVATLGPGLEEARLRVPSNAIVLASASHDAIMRHADLVVTHAGHGTVMRALAHGLPMLCLPMGRDQNDNAARVVTHGAGLELPPTAAPETISFAVAELLAKPSYRQSAARLQSAIVSGEGCSDLVDELEAIAVPGTRPLATACA